MNRRNFIKTAGLSVIAMRYGQLDIKRKPRLASNWAWCRIDESQAGDALIESFERYKNHGIDGLLLRGSNQSYEGVAPLAKKASLQLHAWRPTMLRAEYIDDHPEWYTVNRKGESCAGPNPPYVNYYRWLCPSREEVRDLLINDYKALCDIDNLDGVHLDYVRYCDVFLPKNLQPKYGLVQDHVMAEYDYCYCEVCRDGFKKEYGIDPMNLDDWQTNKDWLEFRLKQIVRVVHAIADAVRKKGKTITAAVFPTPSMSRRMVRQDWAKFNLDAYMPMLYNSYYGEGIEWIGKCVKESVQELPRKVPVYAGIMKGAITGADIPAIYRMVRMDGGSGLSFFMGNNLTDGDLGWLERAVKSGAE